MLPLGVSPTEVSGLCSSATSSYMEVALVPPLIPLPSGIMTQKGVPVGIPTQVNPGSEMGPSPWPCSDQPAPGPWALPLRLCVGLISVHWLGVN